MPIYEYTCEVCHTRFEQYVRSTGAGLQIVCPNCGAEEVKKAWSIFGLSKRSGGGPGASGAIEAACGQPGGT